MMNPEMTVMEELAHAGEASPLSPMVLQLDKYRIASDTEVPAEEFLLRLFGKPCFPRRDITAVTGMEKCGKTFFTSMLMACCAKREVLELERISEKPLRVLWYDTEQSRPSTKSILSERIARLAGDDYDDSRCLVFNVRSCNYQERMDYLVTAIVTYKPDMVIVDNVSDLLPSINDPEESIRIIDQLMQLASTHNCNITVVIHLNRTGEKRSLRGWLGTEILHKAFEVYYCEQLENTNVFMVEQNLTRKYNIPEQLYYKITDEGLPEVTEKPTYQPRDSNGQYMSNKAEAYMIRLEKVDSFNQQYIVRNSGSSRLPWQWDLRRLFDDAMGSCAMMSPATLQEQVMKLSGIAAPKYYEKVFRLAVEQRVVKTTLDNNGRVVVISIPT